MIAVAYAIRSVYSLCFQYYSEFITQRFWKLTLQFLINMIMDFGAIAVVLSINRRTIVLRDLLRREEQKKADDYVKQEIKAAAALIRTDSVKSVSDWQSVDRGSTSSSVFRLNQLND